MLNAMALIILPSRTAGGISGLPCVQVVHAGVRQVRWRAITGGPALCALTGLLAVGCGHSAPAATSADSPASTQAELVKIHDEAQSEADAFAAGARRLRLTHSPAVFGGYQACPGGKDLVAYGYTITIRAAPPASMPWMSSQVAAILRSEGWRLTAVDYAKVHLALADTDHPLYLMSQPQMRGAANILPYGTSSAGAIVFIHSQCINAGALAVQALQGH